MDVRKKKPRFSEREIEVIVQGVKEKSETIHSKFSDVSNSKKKQAWFSILEAVNAVSFTRRTVEEIKKKWDDIKRGTKKKASAVQRERNKTGGGEMEMVPLNNMEEDVVSVLGEERIFGFSCAVDTMKPPTPSKPTASAEIPTFEVSESVHVGSTESSNIESNTPVEKKRRKVLILNESDESLVLQREIVQIQRQSLEIERERLEIERERLRIERRRLAIEEERFQSSSQLCSLNTPAGRSSEYELFSSAFTKSAHMCNADLLQYG